VTIAVLNEIHEDMATGGYASTALYEDELVLIVRASDYQPPDVELLKRYPLAIQAPTSGYRQHLERWARRQQIPLKFGYEHSSFDGILSFVMDGQCIGMVGRYVVEHSPMAPELRVLDLPSFAIRRTVMALHARQIDTLSKHFIVFFRTYYGLSTPEDDSENP
jgi:DNA-binding transcriptional LysR family regulator